MMMYGQLSSCDSLREVICIIDAIKNKSYHLGLGSGAIKLSNVAYANANRDYRIFEEFAYYMIIFAEIGKMGTFSPLFGLFCHYHCSQSATGSVSNLATRHRWIIINNYLTLFLGVLRF